MLLLGLLAGSRMLSGSRGSSGGGQSTAPSVSSPPAPEPAAAQPKSVAPKPAAEQQEKAPEVQSVTPPAVTPRPLASVQGVTQSPVAGLTDKPGDAVGTVPATPPQSGGQLLREPPAKMPRLQVQYLDGNPSRAPKLSTYGSLPTSLGNQYAGPGSVAQNMAPFRYTG